MRWVRWTLVGLGIACVCTYAVDWLLFNLRGSQVSQVTVSHFISAPLNNGKQEIDFLGSEDVTCSISLFPQGGHSPCWYLRSHKNQIKNV